MDSCGYLSCLRRSAKADLHYASIVMLRPCRCRKGCATHVPPLDIVRLREPLYMCEGKAAVDAAVVQLMRQNVIKVYTFLLFRWRPLQTALLCICLCRVSALMLSGTSLYVGIFSGRRLVLVRSACRMLHNNTNVEVVTLMASLLLPPLALKRRLYTTSAVRSGTSTSKLSMIHARTDMQLHTVTHARTPCTLAVKGRTTRCCCGLRASSSNISIPPISYRGGERLKVETTLQSNDGRLA